MGGVAGAGLAGGTPESTAGDGGVGLASHSVLWFDVKPSLANSQTVLFFFILVLTRGEALFNPPHLDSIFSCHCSAFSRFGN
jgi:hypothetical protein